MAIDRYQQQSRQRYNGPILIGQTISHYRAIEKLGRGLFLLLTLLLMAAPSVAEEWSRFRGPNGSGISKDTGFPIKLDPESNLIWKSAVPPGKSSPVLTKDHVFLTGDEGGQLLTLCFDRLFGQAAMGAFGTKGAKRPDWKWECAGLTLSYHRRDERLRILSRCRAGLIRWFGKPSMEDRVGPIFKSRGARKFAHLRRWDNRFAG